MKKSTTRITLLLILILLAVVGYYTYLSSRSRAIADEAAMTAVQKVLNRDLQYDYPSTPREVMKYYSEIQKCFYNEDCTEEEIEALGNRARELYDADLLTNNQIDSYMERLKKEIQEYKDNKRTITGASVAASTNVDTFKEDGYEFARLYCGYNVVDGSGTKQVREVFLLRRDSDRRWKIYGWEDADNVHVGE